ncbi:hypothetical protein [Mesotoga sp. UBA6090]|uniref:hypothetical protein n=1 Tax=Mesotoga sp. UBA6090 TaxID=1946860 RepID=UPI0025D4EB80|nr:hypothetical protein [Mesotoga sp. UBA6090]
MDKMHPIMNSSLGPCIKNGLQAVGKPDRVSLKNTRTKAKSVDIDRCLQEDYPNENRWDYAVFIEIDDILKTAFIEIHPANESEVDEVIKKALWMKRWIRDNQIRVITKNRKFFWVSSGKVSISKNSQKICLLGKHGIQGPQEHLVVDKIMRD